MKGDSDIPVKSDPPTRLSALIGLVVAFGWPLLLLIPGLSTHQITNTHDDIVNVRVKWLVVIVLCVLAFAVQRRGPSELGIRMLGWRDGQRSPIISSANLKFPWTAEKLDRSGGFPRRRVRSGCLPNRSKSSKPTPHATPSRRVVAQLRYRLNPTCFHGTRRTRNEIHASRKRYGVALTFRM